MRHEIPVRSFIVAAALLRTQGTETQVLLLRRQGTNVSGEWCWVAGRMEERELAWQAALREIREETGLVPDRFYCADVCEQFYDIREECISINPVFVGMIDGVQPVTLNEEHSEFEWLSFDEAMRRVPFAGQVHVLEQIRRQFVQREPSRWLRIEVPQG